MWPWLLLGIWIAIIWGHSLMAGPQSSSESQLVVNLVKRVVYRFGLEGEPHVARLLNDPQLLHHYVRKAAHFSEYFVLGVLTFNALRLTFSNPLLGALALVGLWVSVPSIDEYIQRFIPQRSGQASDVLLDMSGFALAFALCTLFALLGALFRSGRSRDW